MKAAPQAGWKAARFALTLCAALLAVALTCIAPAWAQDRGQLFVTQEDGYGRLVLSFANRTTLPDYTLNMDNGVLSITFAQPANIVLPDVGVALPDYISAARVDPDGRGIRFGLRRALNLNRTEAGEQLYIDLMPADWQGPPPPLPPEVVNLIAERNRLAAIAAEQKRKADEIARSHPQVQVRVGRNPTFLRLQFEWTIDTKADFSIKGNTGQVAFEWPVPIDLSALGSSLPAEVVAVTNKVSKDFSVVKLQVADGVTPRFYQETPRSFTLDVDLLHPSLPKITPAELIEKADAAKASQAEAQGGKDHGHETLSNDVGALYPDMVPAVIEPYVSTLGSTVRIVFPFEQDTPAAVFRRGNTVWMVVDTTSGIAMPKGAAALDTVSKGFSVISAGDTQVIRIDLEQDRLATLGSEGRAWVLSLGDILLTPTEPITLTRKRNSEGVFDMTADIERPARVHKFTDPVVGDDLEVVTAYPPARGMLRNLDYVDFTAMRSVHGFVIKPQHDGVVVRIENKSAIISSPGGLVVSTVDRRRVAADGTSDKSRASYVDLDRLLEADPAEFARQRQELMATAAGAEGRGKDMARLNLAQYDIANGYAYESLGVLRLADEELTDKDLIRKLRITTAIADTVINRGPEALAILNSESLVDEIDAMVWRTIARADSYDYAGARTDARAAEHAAEAYPEWVRKRFAFAAIRAAVETGDATMAERLIDAIEFAKLTPEEASLYHLLAGRLDELKGQTAEAIDTYGQVIAADIRPTRAEAVYRTLYLLNQAGNLDLEKATATLSAESMMWRGGPLEAAMQKMLAEFYFRSHAYRQGFETVRQAVANYPESTPINALRDQARDVFVDLFLNGQADALGPVDALSLFYDFRQLTPPGARGDEMIRNLARRLVKVDLLAQAAELLDYQLTNRLKGAAQSQVAADLAVIYLADRQPQEALRVLNATRTPGISTTLQRQRRVIEARAMIDGGRDELALDLLNGMQGRDVDDLRIDAHWRAKRYGKASEMLETMYGGDGGANQPLSQPARMNLVKAAVGYVLAGDRIGLARIRSKFSDAMVTSPEWPMFNYVTSTITTDSLEFKKVARAVSGLDGLNAFLDSYRQTYSADGVVTPFSATKQGALLAKN